MQNYAKTLIIKTTTLASMRHYTCPTVLGSVRHTERMFSSRFSVPQ